MPVASSREGHAIVIGASMAGLTIAKVLSEWFDRVTIVDRDTLPEGPEARKGVPQGRHAHLLLPAGVLALEELFPGVLQECVDDGAPTCDVLRNGRWYLGGRRLARGAVGHQGILSSRPFLESHVKRRVLASASVTLLDGTDVLGLTTSPDRSRVTGIRLVDGRDGRETELPATLVVDCSGRRSRVPGWLEVLGYEAPAVDELHVDVHYSTRQYVLPDDALDGDLLCLIGYTPDAGRSGIVMRIEDGRWICLLAGIAGERPPLDPAEFEPYTAGLVTRDLHDAIRAGTPVNDPVPYRFPANSRRRYERLERFPAGLLAAGDAMCSFNPVYAQGMTVATLQARTLRTLLEQRDGDTLQPAEWFQAITPLVDAPWELAVGGDLALPQVAGPRPPQVVAFNGYIARVLQAAAADPALATLFVRVSGMVDPAEALLSPDVMSQVGLNDVEQRALLDELVPQDAPEVATP